MDLANISRRIGLGGIYEISHHDSVSELIKSAIEMPVTFLGIPAIGADVENWPNDKEFDLNDRIQKLVKRRANEDAIDKKKLPDAERDKARRVNWQKYSVDEID